MKYKEKKGLKKLFKRFKRLNNFKKKNQVSGNSEARQSRVGVAGDVRDKVSREKKIFAKYLLNRAARP